MMLKNNEPSFFVRTEVNHFTGEYQDGDTLAVRAICEADAYLYVFYQQADGAMFMIFPNRIQPQDKVKAKEWVAIPAEDDLFRWRIGPPLGKEVIKVIAAKMPVQAWALHTGAADRFQPVQRREFELAARELAKRPRGDWAEQSTQVLTTERGAGHSQSKGRRLALIVGVSENKYDSLVDKAFHDMKVKPKPRALPSCANDARHISTLLADLGRLDEQRVLVGSQATRANIEAAITEWLPSVSKPGDTIFIYHSGHGGQVDDDNGDEGQADKKDEYLVPYDFAGLDALVASRRLEQADVYQSLMALAGAGSWPTNERAANDWIPKVENALIRKTGITDDQFGLWLQNLDGRQIVFILDICHAGGFAAKEKGESIDRGVSFDYLDRELCRLKDIGQRDTAVLAACRTAELSQAAVYKTKDSGLLISVMTYFLIDPLVNAAGPVELTEAYELCRSGMKKYFASKGFLEAQAEARKVKHPLEPFEPVLYSELTHAAFLRP